MCLSVPSKITHIDENNMATVEAMGVTRKVTLDLMPEPVEVGDYILIHVGFAMGKIDEKSAKEGIALYEEMIAIMEEEERQMEERQKKQ